MINTYRFPMHLNLIKRMTFTGICLFLLMTITHEGFSQDIHFSNYSAVPVFLNPATTGMFNGDLRLITAYKNQWANITNPYSTFYSSFDVNLSNNKVTNKIIGASLSFFNDKAGSTQMGSSQANLSVACNVQVNDQNYIGAGIKAGIAEMGYTTANVRWDSQYSNGIVDPSAPTGETDMNASFRYLDFGGGALWTFNGENNLKASSGIAFSKAGSAFFEGNLDNPYKLVLHSTGQIPIAKGSTFLVPYLSYIQYASNTEFNIGSLFKYDIGLNSKYTGKNMGSAVYIGAIYRNKDAVIAIAKLDFRNFLSFSFCYDITISELSVATRKSGGPELSLTYIGHLKPVKSNSKTFL